MKQGSFGWATNVKLGKYFVNFGVVVVPNVLIFWELYEATPLLSLTQTHTFKSSLWQENKTLIADKIGHNYI